MRNYLSLYNLKDAALLAVIILAGTVPWLIYTGVDLSFFLPSSFLLLTLMAGMVTAWGKSAGMVGYLPEKKVIVKGVILAAAAVILAAPLQILWLDPMFMDNLRQTGNSRLIHLRFPETLSGNIAMVLWSAGFMMLFFQAAALSFFSRLTGRLWLAILLTAAFRMTVAGKQLSDHSIAGTAELVVLIAGLSNAFSCYLFARFGLPASAVFSGGLSAHLIFLRPV